MAAVAGYRLPEKWWKGMEKANLKPVGYLYARSDTHYPVAGFDFVDPRVEYHKDYPLLYVHEVYSLPEDCVIMRK